MAHEVNRVVLNAKRVIYLILILLHISILVLSLLFKSLWIWLLMGWRIRKARKSFERELIEYGVSKNDAKRIGAQYIILKKNLKEILLGRLRLA